MPAAVASKAQPAQSFNKQLASSNRQIRDQALERLRLYLSRSTTFTPLDCLKLWKGLFYCMFMSDKPLNQQRLARSLASLVDVLTTRENTLNFLEGFWKILSREWNAIDSLRLDKYLYLIRCYVRKGFELCLGPRGQKWKLVEDYLAILRDEGGPLNSRDPKVSVGLRLHVLDVWVDELDKEDTSRTAPVETFMAPLRALVKETLTASVRKRAKEALDDERVEDWKNEKPKAKIDEDGGDADMSDRPDQGEGEENAEFAGFDD